MAFNGTNFSIFAQTLAGGAIRLYVYSTTDSLTEVTEAGYFTRIDQTGARVNDLVVVITSGVDVLCVVTGIDENGDGTVAVTTDESSFRFATRAVARASAISSSINYIKTNGYAVEGDGIARFYKRVADNPGHSAAFQSADGAWWDLSEDNPEITSQEFGAKWDGATLDGAKINECISWAVSRGKAVALPIGTALLETSVLMLSGLRLRGRGPLFTELKLSTAHSTIAILDAPGGAFPENVHVSNMKLNGDADNSPVGPGGLSLLHAYNCTGLVAEDLYVWNGRGYGIGFQGYFAGSTGKRGPQTDLTLRRIWIDNCGNGLNAQTTLSISISDVDTSMTVADGSIFDQSGGTLLVGSEIIRHGIPSGNVLPITRAALGTTAAAHTAGVAVYRSGNGDGMDIKSGLRMELDQVRATRCGDKGINIRCKYLQMTQSGGVQCITGMDINAIGTEISPTTTLTADPGVSGSTFAVVSTTDFPTSGAGRVQTEAIAWTGKTATTLTGVTRGLHGTIAVAHPIDSTVAYDPVDDSGDTYANLDGCYAEDNLLSGISITAGQATASNHINLKGCTSLRNGGGVNMSGGGAGRLLVQISGGWFLKNDVDGIYAEQADMLSVVGAFIHSNGEDGINLVACTNGGSVTNCDIRDNGAYGVLEQQGTDGFFYASNRVRGNVTAQYAVGGANSSIATRNVPFSGNQTYQDASYTSAWTPGLVVNGTSVELTISATASLGDIVSGSFNQVLATGCFITYRAVANQVRVTLTNLSGSDQTIVAGTVRAIVRKASALH